MLKSAVTLSGAAIVFGLSGVWSARLFAYNGKLGDFGPGIMFGIAVAALCLPLLFGLIGLVVTAVVAVLVFVWARPRNKASPRGPNGAQREGGSSAAHAPPGAAGRTS